MGTAPDAHVAQTHEASVLRQDFSVMGTVVSFDVRRGAVSGPAARRAMRAACTVLARLDAVFSLWKPDSPMSRLRRGDITLGEAPPEVVEVLDRCDEVRRRTHGWFDPWSMPGGLDPTGLVKGWAATRALAVLVDAGVAGAMVNAGGDVATAGEPAPGAPWRIGITDPRDPGRLLCAVVSPGAVATSGTYERGLHLIDPFSGLRRSAYRSATVVGSDLALADALATALCVSGTKGASSILAAGYGAIVVAHDGVARVIGDVAAEAAPRAS